MIKIILINPPDPQQKVWLREWRCQQEGYWGTGLPPLTLAYLKGMLKDKAQVKIIDASAEQLSLELTMKAMLSYSPDILLMATISPTLDNDCRWFAAEVKRFLPKTILGAWGAQVTVFPQKTLHDYKDVDFVICGEPEHMINSLIDSFSQNKQYNNVHNIVYRDKSAIIQTEKKQYNTSLDLYGLPDWSDLCKDKYTLPISGKPFRLISVSRGCPFGCEYCVTAIENSQVVRFRTKESIMQEIDLNLKEGISDFIFWSDLINADRDWLDGLLELLIDKGYGQKIAWMCTARVDLLDEKILLKLRRAGCWQIALGLEFGTDKALALAGKGGKQNVAKATQLVRIAKKTGLVVDAHFILGYPGEEMTDMLRTIDYACSLPLTFAQFYTPVPYPGTPLFLKQELALSKLKNEQLVQDQYVFSKYAKEDMVLLLKKAYWRFYFSPKRIYYILKLITSFAAIKNIIFNGFCFLEKVVFKNNKYV